MKTKHLTLRLEEAHHRAARIRIAELETTFQNVFDGLVAGWMEGRFRLPEIEGADAARLVTHPGPDPDTVLIAVPKQYAAAARALIDALRLHGAQAVADEIEGGKNA